MPDWGSFYFDWFQRLEIFVANEEGEYLPPPDEKYVQLCRRLENAYLGRFLNHDALWAEKQIPTAVALSTDDARRAGVIDAVIFLDRE